MSKASACTAVFTNTTGAFRHKGALLFSINRSIAKQGPLES